MAHLQRTSEHEGSGAGSGPAVPPLRDSTAAPVSQDVHVQTLLPAVDLTPATTATLQGLQPTYANSPVGTRGAAHLGMRPIGDQTTVLDPACLAAHLGFPVPQIPALQRRGCTTSVRHSKWKTVLDHPVPRATAPPPPVDPASDRHSVLVVHLPPGIDAGEVVIEGYPPEPAGVGWMRITWGGYTAVPGDPGDDDPQMWAWEESRSPCSTTLRSSGSPPVYVLRRGKEQTSASWRALAAGSLFDVTLVLPFAPLQAVSALSEAAAEARRRD